ncbi:hypothetical protein [Lentzea sp. NBRC 105346]|uniref:hypothetical protein n=1 Tax=Lentzea sp. NBRC 105346 TaxID=3032205 RepID=UPI0025530862|nr:hypothetical protein [Lentzea sp. NBRC 105346]
MRRLVHAVIALLLVLPFTVGSAVAESPPAWFVDESKLPFAALPGTDTARYWGVHGGAGYRVEVPRDWNGRLVLWAHGYRGEGLELTVDNGPLRPWLVTHGYAWAASSYASNGYDVAQGVKDTHALAQLFDGLVAHPSKTYLVGASMGGHITAASIEQYPRAYDGAMPVCGVLGDHELFDFFLDYTLVAQNLAGLDEQFPVQEPAWSSSTVPTITSTLAAAWPNGLTTAGEHLKAMTELRSGGIRPMYDAAWVSWASFLLGLPAQGDGTMPRSPGIVVDNTDAVYQFDTDPALSADEQALNDTVLRVAQDPQGRVDRGMANVPVLDGRITVPVLTMHDLGDLFVPFSMEQIYAQRVAAQGRSGLLVQRAIRGVGHCDFTAAEFTTGFTDLVRWVEQGVRPAGDTVLDRTAVAAPAYGCAFTTATRPLGPFTAPCP